jgi:hypothetical protein
VFGRRKACRLADRIEIGYHDVVTAESAERTRLAETNWNFRLISLAS